MEQAAGKIAASDDEGKTLPRGWVMTTVGDVLELRYGKGLPQSKRDGSGSVPVYGSNGVVGYHSQALTEEPCIIIGRKGTAGAVHISMVPAWPIDTTYYTQPPLGLSLKFAYYLLGFLGLDALDRSTAIPGLNRDDAYAQHVPIPPPAEQRRIVEAIETHFTRLDAGVAGLKQLQAKLKRYRAAVLKAAVEGTLTAEWRAGHPDAEPAAALLQRILQERRSAWEQAELARFAKAGKTPPKGWQDKHKEPTSRVGEGSSILPKQWQWVSIEHLLIEPTCNGISVKGADRPPGVPALRLSAMSSSGFNYADRRYIPIDETRAASLAIRSGDFFVSRGNGSLHLVGRGTLAQEPPERVVFPDTMIRLRLSSLLPLRRYVNIVWSTRLLRKQIETKARTTAGIYKISQRDIEAFALPLPPLAEQEQIVAEVERRLSVVAEAEAQVEAGLKRAERLRQGILKRAFAGELVAQDPDDEPAAALLERIRRQRGAGATAEQSEQAVQLRLV